MSEDIDVVTTEHVNVVQTEHGVEITLDRPDKRNAITLDMYDAMRKAFEAAERDGARSILLRGEGVTFSSGNDVQGFLSAPLDEANPALRFIRTVGATTVPIVVAVQGPCVGIGATLLLHADYVAAADDTTLTYPFVTMALVPELASSLLLPRVVGYLRASEILLAGEPVPADRALELGLVSRVVPLGEQDAAARAFAEKLAAQPPAAVRMTRSLMKDDAPGVADRINEEIAMFSGQLKSPEFFEYAQAFMEKRKPDYTKLGGQQ